ncbi:hypothetical protein G9A89_004910 [Geosiphon pyriformis]|nr:hypothetical protein G9A89_004910 [Geosiphon pyriformis]
MSVISLPTETLVEIFQYFQDDNHSLFSCLKVNRLFARNSVSILWKFPFKRFKNVKSHKSVVRALLSSMDDTEKHERLGNISNDLLNDLPKAIFDYTTFIAELDVANLSESVTEWYLGTRQKDKRVDWQHANIQKAVTELCRTVLISSNCLISLKLSAQTSFVVLPHFANFLYDRPLNLKNLEILRIEKHMSGKLENALEIFPLLTRHCQHLSLLSVMFDFNYPSMIDQVASIIKNQLYLQTVLIKNMETGWAPLVSALSTQHKSLRRIEFHSCDLDELPVKDISSFNNLNTLVFINSSKNRSSSQLWTPLMNANIKIEKLFFSFDITIGFELEISPIIQKAGKYLLDLVLPENCEPQIFNYVRFSCPNLQKLSVILDKLDGERYRSALGLFANCGNLKELSLNYISDNKQIQYSEHWCQLARILPASLTGINFGIEINANDLSNFFANSSLPKLRKIGFSCGVRYVSNLIPAIISFAEINQCQIEVGIKHRNFDFSDLPQYLSQKAEGRIKPFSNIWFDNYGEYDVAEF